LAFKLEALQAGLATVSHSHSYIKPGVFRPLKSTIVVRQKSLDWLLEVVRRYMIPMCSVWNLLYEKMCRASCDWVINNVLCALQLQKLREQLKYEGRLDLLKVRTYNNISAYLIIVKFSTTAMSSLYYYIINFTQLVYNWILKWESFHVVYFFKILFLLQV